MLYILPPQQDNQAYKTLFCKREQNFLLIKNVSMFANKRFLLCFLPFRASYEQLVRALPLFYRVFYSDLEMVSFAVGSTSKIHHNLISFPYR